MGRSLGRKHPEHEEAGTCGERTQNEALIAHHAPLLDSNASGAGRYTLAI